MIYKILPRAAFAISAIAALAMNVIGITIPAFAYAQSLPAAQGVPPASAPAHPVNISIATSGTNAAVIPVGVTPSGNLDVPHNFVQAGWYAQGPVPGQSGSAVIDGHVDNGASIPGIFKHLTSVNPGDKIVVAMSDGTDRTFIVLSSDIYRTDQFPSNQVFAADSRPLLKLITCNGTFVPSTGTYDHRLVVTAILS